VNIGSRVIICFIKMTKDVRKLRDSDGITTILLFASIYTYVCRCWCFGKVKKSWYRV